ncbi:OPT family oligopeptide transporter [Myxococcus stipitatus DSM 14675]|uniref:OPT family oligopeptide transporter n=1 Tax=Myxococcus stipitatus (strain DSM 14675 / JCM 12634 / Mx s8) TaxID=1278073 RepID=L7U264_MYXSD|nr:OPT family oligopeptide transporter [Myxococcus stipitatus]AGC42303.1 OPT family oligopeptide transporter [Myxococcus stipitatus DSM 14675]
MSEPAASPVTPRAGVAHVETVPRAHPAEGGEPRESTARALGMGGVIGALLAVTNVSMGLKLGWWESGSVMAAVLGFGGMAAVSRARGSPYTPLENNLTQVTAVSVGAMPAAAGLLGPLPALMLLGMDVPGVAVAAWSVALGILGVLAAHLLRRRLMEEEALPFPTGIATAELITAMHASEPRANKGRGVWLVVAGVVATGVTVLRDILQRLPGMVAVPGSVGGVPAASLAWGVAWSPMLVAVGMMAGLHLGLSMLLGALVAWGGLSPWLVSTGVVKEAGYDSLLSWLTWPGVGLLVGSALVSLLAQARDFRSAARDLRSLGRGELLPRWAWGWGAGAALLSLGLGVAVFGLSVSQVLLSLALLLPLCAVCARGAGQVDVSPVTQVGQLSQVAAGVALPGSVASNIGVGGLVSGAAAQTGVSLWALKAGHLLGASSRRMLAAQLLGVLVGSLVSVPAYLLLTRAYGLGSQALPAPFSHQFRAVAELAARGLEGMPAHAALAGAVAAGVGALLTLLARGRMARWVPSPVAMGIGFILPAYFAVTLCLGGVIAAIARWRWPQVTGRNVPALAAGAIAAESLVGVLIGALKLLGVMS